MKAEQSCQPAHIPVMLNEALEGLQIYPEGIYLDGTFGRGGHARELLKQLGSQGRLLVMDRDAQAIDSAKQEFGADARVSIQHGNFAELGEWLETQQGLDGVLLDLGVSSPQLDDPLRGFSFQTDGPLDMRMDPSQGLSAAQWLAGAAEREIVDVLWEYGEERLSRRIAQAIVATRQQRPLTRTGELADLVAKTIGYRERGKHPATRSFQALRIHLNDELAALKKGLQGALTRLKPGGRLVVISFHSLEDRVVKRFIRGQESTSVVRRKLPPLSTPDPLIMAVGKAQFASAAEVVSNPRARSAVLRVARKC